MTGHIIRKKGDGTTTTKKKFFELLTDSCIINASYTGKVMVMFHVTQGSINVIEVLQQDKKII
jgi:hypothetical protein